MNCFTKLFQKALETNERYSIRVRPLDQVEIEEDELAELMQDLLRESIADVSEQGLVEQVIDNCIILEVNGDEYPFVYLGDIMAT